MTTAHSTYIRVGFLEYLKKKSNNENRNHSIVGNCAYFPTISASEIKKVRIGFQKPKSDSNFPEKSETVRTGYISRER